MEINEIEKEILKFWEKDKTFEKSLKKTKNKKPYVFYDGPPFATGTPHYGHILGSVVKDIFGRFWTMKGRYVRRVWGWDCHGLPVENIAEKEMGINSKDEIEKIGVKKFNDFCRKKVLEYDNAWKKFIPRIGRWVDMENSYKTMDNEYIESIWWAFKQIWEKGFIYQGEKVLMYCPRCSTPLAKAEIAMDNSYRNVKEDSVIVKFKLKNEDAYALAWTTTPWTLPSNLALTVNPNFDYIYVKDKSNGEVYLMARSVLDNFFKDIKDYEVVKEIKGKKLEGKEYEPLFSYFNERKDSFKFLLGNFVTSEEGTGIVHTAPAFGEDDYAVCKKYRIGIVQPVDDKGRFTSEVGDFKGMFVHDSNKAVIDFLKKENKVVLIKKIEHEYPFCYRCDTKLIYRAIPAWFVNIQKIKPRVLQLSKKINWYPGFLKEGRVKYTIETAPDWNISRNRYWAAAIPVWVAEDGELLVIGSVEELKKYSKNLKGKIDLHKDCLDKIILNKDGKEFKRVPEVLDCWFESGAMTFAQFHYPFENKKEFESSLPAQFVAEYIAQVRTWFYYMMILSTILFDKVPFENVVTTGTLLAEDGQKMSKSKKTL
ncbi:MAG: isoleucine--tRNA ligase [Nanoarchaeota archaeon]|nr:isoleucine--tRNA ligase [Nanoarchaeota archaeon]